MDKSVQNGIVGSVAHMLGMHDRLFARCFCRYSGNIASDISYIKKQPEQIIAPAVLFTVCFCVYFFV